jgi:signal transduction histidine kinase
VIQPSISTMAGQLHWRDNHLRLACLLLVAAIGLYAAYAGLFEPKLFENTPRWGLQWTVGYILFVAAYLLAPQSDETRNRPILVACLSVQSAAALFLVWLYPSFIVTSLLVIVAWQIAWAAPLRTALVAAGLQAVALAVMKCTTESSSSFPFLILIVAIGFQAFAISAARLARSEARAHDELARVNSELRAAQALMTENARMSERLSISRDLHDILGHSLTTLTIHLDVAARLSSGQTAEHVQCARDVAGALLAEVRTIVNRVRVDPVDLRTTLLALTKGAVGLEVDLSLPEELWDLDPARVNAIVRCTQEAITNTLRHAQASQLVIELEQAVDGSVCLAIRDNGHGGSFREGGGLAGMRERFERLGGKLSVASAPGQGFSIRGTIPATAGVYS